MRLIQIIFMSILMSILVLNIFTVFTHPWHERIQFGYGTCVFPPSFPRLVLYSCRSSVWSRVTDVSSWIVTKCAQPTETNRLIIARSANFCNGNFKLGCDRGDAFFLIFFPFVNKNLGKLEN